MFGVEMIWIIVGVLVLILGALLLRRIVMTMGTLGIVAVLLWLVILIVIMTYAEQHDDPAQLYVINSAAALGVALAGFYASLIVINTKFKALNQRLDDHCTSDAKVFGQFEKRMIDRLDIVDGKIDGLVSRKKGGL